MPLWQLVVLPESTFSEERVCGLWTCGGMIQQATSKCLPFGDRFHRPTLLRQQRDASMFFLSRVFFPRNEHGDCCYAWFSRFQTGHPSWWRAEAVLCCWLSPLSGSTAMYCCGFARTSLSKGNRGKVERRPATEDCQSNRSVGLKLAGQDVIARCGRAGRDSAAGIGPSCVVCV